MKRTIVLSFLFLGFCLLPINAQTSQQGNRVFQNKKVALVVGNSDYLIGPLRNPVNDARAMKLALEKTGFEVLYHENITNKDNFTRAVRAFGQKLQNGEVGLFYFAGHGLQVKGINYLVPIKAEVLSEPEVEFECLDVGFVLAQMEAANNRMNIVILDACRNNPFARSFRSAERGLATMMAPTGTLIAYATAPGSVAADGEGENGLYTEHILKQITRPGLKIEEVFKNVRAEVVQISNNRQVPWEASSLIGDFYFALSDTQESTLAVQSETKAQIQNQNQINRNTETKEDFNLFKGQTETSKSNFTSVTNNYWFGANNMYWLMVNGENIELDTYSQWAGADLLVTHNATGKSYLLKDFYKNSDSQWREALEVDISSLVNSINFSAASYDLSLAYANWIGSDEGFWMYLNGNDITQEVTSEWQNQHLKVYHAKSGMSFLLRDYNLGLDKLVRPAEIILQTWETNQIINVQWRALGNTYWFAINGIDHTSNSYSQFEGTDLVIYHQPTGKRFRVYNYSLFLDNIWRPIYPEN
jgi:hypothetical protein